MGRPTAVRGRSRCVGVAMTLGTPPAGDLDEADQLRRLGVEVAPLPPLLAVHRLAVVARSIADGSFHVLVADGLPEDDLSATFAAVWPILTGMPPHPPWRVVRAYGPLRSGGPYLVVGLRRATAGRLRPEMAQ